MTRSSEADVADGIARAFLLVAATRARLARGRVVDVMPIQAAVDGLCNAVAAGGESARPFLDRLARLDGELASLGAELAQARSGDDRLGVTWSAGVASAPAETPA